MGTMDTTGRLVDLEGTCNFRDLGGYRSADGRTVRWGRLYRSDALHQLTPADLDVLRGLGLRTVVDLRTEREVHRSGPGPLVAEGVDVHHLAVVKEGVRGEGAPDGTEPGEAVAAPAPAGDDLAERYLWYLEVGGDAIARALALFAEPGRLPVVFHCAAGKDRTGVLAAIVLELLGVDRAAIVADYVITAERLQVLLERWRSEPGGAERMARVPPSRLTVEARTMEGFLDGLDAVHGGARAWALGAGVPAGTLGRMTELLLEPDL